MVFVSSWNKKKVGNETVDQVRLTDLTSIHIKPVDQLTIPLNKSPWYQPFLVFALGKVAVCTSMFWQLWSFRVVQEGLKCQGFDKSYWFITIWWLPDKCQQTDWLMILSMKSNSLKSWNENLQTKMKNKTTITGLWGCPARYYAA